MSRGVRSVTSRLRSDDWEGDAPNYVYTRVAQPSAAPALRRKCGPSNPTLPITPINPNWVTIALATFVLLVSGALIDRAAAQSVRLQATHPRLRSPVDFAKLLSIPRSTGLQPSTRPPAPKSPPTTSISILSTAAVPVLWPRRLA